MLKITAAQINPTIGDIAGNVKLMVDAARQAQAAAAHVVVFPELSLTAYYPCDMLDEPGFAEQVAKGFNDLLRSTEMLPDLYWVVGTPTRREGPGKPWHNSLAVLKNGKILLGYSKQLLPTYNIFDERRHFEPGPDKAAILSINDTRVGFLICEDGWNDEGTDYSINPFSRLQDAQPDLVVSINASPANIGKREQRHSIFSRASAHRGFPILYVNQVGGHDQLVYDGASFAVEPDAGVVFEAARFESDITTLQFHRGHFAAADGSPLAPITDGGLPTMEFYYRQIILGLQDYARRCGFTQAVVGSSGGIDSALTLALAVAALGRENVVAITMPSRYSSSGSVTDSVVLCQNLGIPLLTHPIKAMVDQHCMDFEASDSAGIAPTGLALENLQARVRGTILMTYSNQFGHLLLTTGNKSEVSVGYATLYGDMAGGLNLIGDLYKTEVFELSRYINARAGREIIPTAIIEKEPSAELAPGQKDTDSLPPYPVLDDILRYLLEYRSLSEQERIAADERIAALEPTPEGRATIARVRGLIARSEYKRRQAPPIIRVRARAFGSGRQMPIAAKY